MEKFKIVLNIFLIFVFLLALTGCNSNEENVQNNNIAFRLSTNYNSEDFRNTTTHNNYAVKEEVLSEFATTILDTSEGRLTNINLTCNELTNTIIHKGEIFSFNNIVGQPTAEEGYQEASIIINGKKESGIGGGNCQVSSTIYNAAVNLEGITIIERNEHGKPVAYVEEGKDATVSYGSLDLQFRNDLGYDIKLQVTTDNQSIIAKIIKVNN